MLHQRQRREAGAVAQVHQQRGGVIAGHGVCTALAAACGEGSGLHAERPQAQAQVDAARSGS
jgi:hypothetical protein